MPAAAPDDLTACRDWLPDLFAILWYGLRGKAAKILMGSWLGGRAVEAKSVRALLEKSPDGRVPDEVQLYLQGSPDCPFPVCDVPPERLDERAFVVAQCIDDCFESIHPRQRKGAPSKRAGQGWRLFQQQRTSAGHYNRQTHHGLVIPKGPLRIDAEAPDSCGTGNQLRDQFTYLTLAKAETDAHAVKITVGRPRTGAELPSALRVGFIPLAQHTADLAFNPGNRGGSAFLEVRPVDDAVLAVRACAAIDAIIAVGVHIALLPELTVSPPVLAAVKRHLSKLTEYGELKVVVMGSGLADNPGGHPFNRCIVLDRRGRVMWQQDKLNPYRMSPANVATYGIATTLPEEAHCEVMEAGSVLAVHDHPLLGRMIALICEDLTCDDPAHQVCPEILSDWIFNPVLDGSLKVGRWGHEEAKNYSSRHGARVIIVTSMSMEHRRMLKAASGKAEEIGIGFCVDKNLEGKQRVAIARAAVPEDDGDVIHRTIDWQPDDATKWHEFRTELVAPAEA